MIVRTRPQQGPCCSWSAWARPGETQLRPSAHRQSYERDPCLLPAVSAPTHRRPSVALAVPSVVGSRFRATSRLFYSTRFHLSIRAPPLFSGSPSPNVPFYGLVEYFRPMRAQEIRATPTYDFKQTSILFRFRSFRDDNGAASTRISGWAGRVPNAQPYFNRISSDGPFMHSLN